MSKEKSTFQRASQSIFFAFGVIVGLGIIISHSSVMWVLIGIWLIVMSILMLWDALAYKESKSLNFVIKIGSLIFSTLYIIANIALWVTILMAVLAVFEIISIAVTIKQYKSKVKDKDGA